ncbi:hypothetical protein FHX64_002727 [Microbacter margulisiae]|uniref:Uncharacterized protein n=1 Tax=Microbacter margulisiae TaxID=1350067 RepID=A0A7W5DTZ6_9PORP|nr:hypothetical protein [Microbacter margulisiae]
MKIHTRASPLSVLSLLRLRFPLHSLAYFLRRTIFFEAFASQEVLFNQQVIHQPVSC